MKLAVILALSLFVSPFASAQDIATQVLAELNFARTQPQAYAAVVAANARPGREGQRAIDEAVRFLQKAKPLPALLASTGLTRSAMDHVVDTGARGQMTHSGSDGSRSWDRAERYGRWVGMVGENISFGYRSARQIVVTLLVDEGVRGRRHRANIFQRNFRVVGVAVGAHSTAGTMCVTDFAGGYIEASTQLAKL